MIERPRIHDLSSDARDRILCFLHYHYAMTDHYYFTEEEIFESIHDSRARMLQVALYDLINSDEVDLQVTSEPSGDVQIIGLSREGVEIVERWDDEKYTKVSQFVTFDHDEGIPASNRFVAIDHNSPETVRGIEALKSVIAEAKKSNQFKELFTEPEDAAAVISEFEHGLSIVETARASVVAVKTLLIDRLKWLQSKIPDWAGSASVGQALEWLIKHFIGGE